jgi:hypothetical protein
VVATWRARIAIGGALLPSLCLGAEGETTYLPGHHFVRTYLEDSRNLGAVGIDLGWNAVWSEDLIVAPNTGLRLIQRHQTDQPIFGWTATLQLAGTTPVAPYLELGFDAGEALGELLIDRLRHDDEEENWIDPDTFAAAGFQIRISDGWIASVYYKVHYIEGADDERLRGAELLGLSVTRRFARRVLQWWQRPP